MLLKKLKITQLYKVSLPGYTWDVGLRYTNKSLERIQDVNMFQSFESGIRLGISGVFGNRYLESDNENKIKSVNQNNLYGWAMMQALPHGEFKEESNNNIEDVSNTVDDNEIGYVILVDINNLYHIE